ncbi:MAG: YitT family protein [Dorea sp.]
MKKDKKKLMTTIAGIVVGNIILAFTVAAFIVPFGVIMGGATGVSLTISHYLPGINLSIIVYGVNAVLFLIGAIALGKSFIIATIGSAISYPTFLAIMQAIPGIETLTDNVMLATVYAGVLLGIGIGIIVRVGSSTGGTDIIAIVLNKITHISVSILLYIIDFTVLGMQVLFSDPEQVMYGIIMLVLQTVIMNKVMVMGQAQIQMFIISDKYEEIREKMLKDQNIGVTMVHIESGYGKQDKKAVMCILSNRKLFSAREKVHEIDEHAFITIQQVSEVHGQGFTLERISYENYVNAKEVQ